MRCIEEIYWLRAYGCMAVFTFHLLDHLDQRLSSLIIDLTRIPTVLGTPIFLFISVFLFASRYGSTTPPGFLRRRLSFLLVPYLTYGLVYSTAEYVYSHTMGSRVGLMDTMVEYVLYAGWHGYFLLIAVQFYVFYWLFCRYNLRRFLPPTPWLILGGAISMFYWGFWHWQEQAVTVPGHLHWIAPLGWCYLFFLALVIVEHSNQTPTARSAWRDELARPRWLLAMLGMVVVLSLPGWLEYSSKETWVIPLFVLFTLWLMSHLRGRQAPPWVKQINEFSFGIYLAHPMFFNLVDILDGTERLPVWSYVLLLASVGMAGSIGLNVIANRFSLGGLLLGKRLKVSYGAMAPSPSH